jgi:hypothetical protein
VTTYAVTPSLFVGLEPPPGISDPVFNLQSGDFGRIVSQAVGLLSTWPWGDDTAVPAVVVPNPMIAHRVLVELGLTEEQAQARCDFAVRSWRNK